MNSHIRRIATQNIQWGGDPLPGGDGTSRLPALAPQLAALDADILVLTEYKGGERGDELVRLLGDEGYPHFACHSARSSSLGAAIASRHPFKKVALPVPATVDPWRSVAVNVRDVTMVGFYFPLYDAKPPYWDWVLANATELRNRDVILAGDFNTGKRGIDELGHTLLCEEKQRALEELGFVDCWRAAHPDGREYTWFSSAGNGFRLDYLWASPSIAPRISSVRHIDGARTTRFTDHSAVVADLTSS